MLVHRGKMDIADKSGRRRWLFSIYWPTHEAWRPFSLPGSTMLMRRSSLLSLFHFHQIGLVTNCTDNRCSIVTGPAPVLLYNILQPPPLTRLYVQMPIREEYWRPYSVELVDYGNLCAKIPNYTKNGIQSHLH